MICYREEKNWSGQIQSIYCLSCWTEALAISVEDTDKQTITSTQQDSRARFIQWTVWDIKEEEDEKECISLTYPKGEEARSAVRSFQSVEKSRNIVRVHFDLFFSVTSPLAERKGERLWFVFQTIDFFLRRRRLFPISILSFRWHMRRAAVFATIQSLALSCFKCPKKKGISARSKGENSIKRIRAMNEQMCTTNNGSSLKSIGSFILRERKK